MRPLEKSVSDQLLAKKLEAMKQVQTELAAAGAKTAGAKTPDGIDKPVAALPAGAKEKMLEAMLLAKMNELGIEPPKPGQEEEFWKKVDQLDVNYEQLGPDGKKVQRNKLDDLALGAVTLYNGDPTDPKNYIPDETARFMRAAFLSSSIRAEKNRVLYEGYPNWVDTNKAISEAVSKAGVVPVSSPAFVDKLSKLADAMPMQGNQVTVLGLGQNDASLRERLAMIRDAKSSIDLAVWKIYAESKEHGKMVPDAAGEALVAALVAKKQANPAMPVRVIVDGNVNTRDPKEEALLRRLEAAGVEVMRWKDAAHPMSGMHWKAMIVDGNKVIAGGRNVGMEYLGQDRWRDTDLRIDGPAALAADQKFAQLWNAGIAKGPPETKTSGTKALVALPVASAADLAKANLAATKSGTTVLQINDVPGPKSAQNVTKAIVMAIDGASKSIDINQCYFMDVPAVMQAIERARKRGVAVNLYTNSATSIDMPPISRPILQASLAAQKMGVNVAVRTGTETLHSKFMVVDDKVAFVGSWNQHPRSLILEAEGMTVLIDDAKSGAIAALSSEMKSDVSGAGAPLLPTDAPAPSVLDYLLPIAGSQL